MPDNLYLSGSINTRTLDEQMEQMQLYAKEGWELHGGPATHRVRIMVPADRVPDFCEWLLAQPEDNKVERFTTRDGEQVERHYVSFYLDGREMSGSWTKLSRTIKDAPSTEIPF